MSLAAIWRFLLPALALVATGWAGWQMLEKPLWSFLPWVFFGGLWWLLFTLLGWRRWADSNQIRLAGASTLSGLLLAAAFPVSVGTILIFIAWVPLLWVSNTLQSKGTPAKSVFYYAYHTFAVWNICTTWWVANTAFIAGLVAIFLNSFFMAVVFWSYYKVQLKLTPFLRLISLPVFWTCFEYLHLNWEISWPWLNLGNYFASRHTWVQWYEYTGVFGGAAWIWIINLGAYEVLKHKLQTNIWRTRQIISLVMGVLVPIIFSILVYQRYEESGTPVRVAVVQPNFEPHYEKFRIPDEAQVNRFLALSRQVITDSVDYLVFPETSFGDFNVDDLKAYSPYQQLIDLVKEHPGLKLITGLSTYKMYTEADKPDRDLYVRKTNQGTIYFEVQNSAIQVDSLEQPQVYLKSKFVPGAEIFPYKHLLPFLKPLVEKLGGSLSDWGQQQRRLPFTSENGRVGPIICYESVYGEYVSGYIKEGANFLAIMTNDGWWDNTPGHKQHAALGKLRAIEQRKSIARSANMGTSGFINQRGDLKAINQYGQEASAVEVILANNTLTFYNRYGDIIARIALFLLFVIALVWGRSFIPQR